jgi:hypothetical protein
VSDDTISGRIDAAIAETGLPPVTDAQIRATLADVAQTYGSPAAAGWVAGLDGENTRALAWLLSPQSRTHCEHGVPYGADCLQCGPSPF